jgi:hypothetical protein
VVTSPANATLRAPLAPPAGWPPEVILTIRLW